MYVGRAGWSLSRTEQAHVPAEGASILERYARRFPAVASSNAPVWCIFDNTALGAATTNAVDLLQRLSGSHTDKVCPDRSETTD